MMNSDLFNAFDKYVNQYSYTENGALTNASTDSKCLDLFANIGALRNNEPDDIINRFKAAYEEDPLIATKILFYARDIRGGIGERRTFRIIAKWLSKNHKEALINNLEFIPDYGRYDDLIDLMFESSSIIRDKVFHIIKDILYTDITNLRSHKISDITLLAKWLPSVNTTNKESVKRAKTIAKMINISQKEYRKTLTKLRKAISIIENNLRTNDYTFDYSKQTSKSLYKYKNAFIRNDKERYEKFLSDVNENKVKINTSNITPYDIVNDIINKIGYYGYGSVDEHNIDNTLRLTLNTTWNNLKDYTNNENSLVIVDGSGSMYSGFKCTPIAVAVSLGIYFATHNKGKFHNQFITFSSNPKTVTIPDNMDIVDMVKYALKFNDVSNTDLKKTFDIILNAAKQYNIPESEMPTKIFIISDMEFDMCINNNNQSVQNFEYIKNKYNEYGYTMPKIIFWNVDSRSDDNMPVKQNESGVILTSGYSTKLFELITSDDINPYKFMLSIINSDRYKHITIA